VHYHRYAVDDWCYEIPAGGIKKGQSLEDAARTELLEEIGGTVATLDYVASFYTMNGIGNEEAHIFFAAGVKLNSSPQHESTEVMDIRPIPIKEVLRMAQANEISDGPSALALLLCTEKLLLLGAEK